MNGNIESKKWIRIILLDGENFPPYYFSNRGFKSKEKMEDDLGIELKGFWDTDDQIEYDIETFDEKEIPDDFLPNQKIYPILSFMGTPSKRYWIYGEEFKGYLSKDGKIGYIKYDEYEERI